MLQVNNGELADFIIFCLKKMICVFQIASDS